MTRLWIFSLICTYLNTSVYTFECRKYGECNCYKYENFEIYCPTEGEDLLTIISENDKSISIQCPYNTTKFRIHQLPNITLDDNYSTLKMTLCPWPHQAFQQILKHFKLTKIKVLDFSISDIQNVTADRFKHLQSLEELKLNENNIADLDVEVLSNTPNLSVLELELNNITLKTGLFRHVPFLNFLDLSGNGIVDIPVDIFKPLKVLSKLHLWNNNLKSLDRSMFKDLIGVKLLDVSINQIETISEDAFQDLGQLTEINLSTNQIGNISSLVFQKNKKLELVRLENNDNLKLPDYLFANLPSLTQVFLTNCLVETIPEHIFENSSSLKVIKLENNKLKSLPSGLFNGLSNLRDIKLQNNNLESMKDLFTGLYQLKMLHLQNNEFSALSFEDFSDLSSLEKIYFQQNRIEHVDSRIFSNRTNLTHINLSHNRLRDLGEILPLGGVPKLSRLDLSHNSISKIKIKEVKFETQTLVNLILDHNQITVVDFQNVVLHPSRTSVSLTIKKNPFVCDCRNFDLINFLKNRGKEKLFIDIPTRGVSCAQPLELENEPLHTLDTPLTCPLTQVSESITYCPEKCECNWRPSNQSIVFNCSYKNFTEFPYLDLRNLDFIHYKQIEVDLQGNNLSLIKEEVSYNNVTRLLLSYNKIEEVQWLPPKLQVLKMHHNLIKSLNEDVVKILSKTSLVTLTLYENPWACDCASVALADFLRNSTAKFYVLCATTKQNLINLKKQDLCNKDKEILLMLVILSVLFTITSAVAVYCRYQQQIKMWLFSKSLCLRWVTEDELDKDKAYDAFISYSHKDEEFVVQELVSVLDGGYKLCLHERDWIPGEFITTQITNSVLQSRRTIVILSKNFLDSVWGKMEFRTAHTQAMNEGRTRVIIVLVGDVDVNNLDEELRMYLKTNTYVRWGETYFWDKLRYALPHKTTRRRTSSFGTNEDAILIQSPPSSPGSTPPVSLSSSYGNIGPLGLVQKTKLPV